MTKEELVILRLLEVVGELKAEVAALKADVGKLKSQLGYDNYYNSFNYCQSPGSQIDLTLYPPDPGTAKDAGTQTTGGDGKDPNDSGPDGSGQP